MKIDYNVTATAFAKNRRLNARTLDRLIQIGKLERNSHALEVGCGSGNYSSALANIVGCGCHGLEPSQRMLAQAKAQSAAVVWIQGHAEAIP